MTSHTHLCSKLDEFGKDYDTAIKKRVSNECMYVDVLSQRKTTTSEQSPGHHTVIAEQGITHHTATCHSLEQDIEPSTEQSAGHHTRMGTSVEQSTTTSTSSEEHTMNHSTTGVYAEQSIGNLTTIGTSAEQSATFHTTTCASSELSPGHHNPVGTSAEQGTATYTSSDHQNLQIVLQPDKGRKITFDNFDIRQEVHHMTEQNQNKDKHYVTVMSTENRTSGTRLRRDGPVGDIAALENGKCGQNHAEYQKQKENCCVGVKNHFSKYPVSKTCTQATDTVCAMIIYFLCVQIIQT